MDLQYYYREASRRERLLEDLARVSPASWQDMQFLHPRSGNMENENRIAQLVKELPCGGATSDTFKDFELRRRQDREWMSWGHFQKTGHVKGDSEVNLHILVHE